MLEQNGNESGGISSQRFDRTGHPMGSRVAADPYGRFWTVREVDASNVPGAQARRSLIFDTAGHCFRLWSYPLDWRELSPRELLVLGRIVPDD